MESSKPEAAACHPRANKHADPRPLHGGHLRALVMGGNPHGWDALADRYRRLRLLGLAGVECDETRGHFNCLHEDEKFRLSRYVSSSRL